MGDKAELLSIDTFIRLHFGQVLFLSLVSQVMSVCVCATDHD